MNRLRIQRFRLCRLLLASALAGSALTFTSGCNSKSQAEKIPRPVDASIPVTTFRAALQSMDRAIPVTGTLYAKDEATLSAEVEGRVEKTLVEFGDEVKAGQELALINTTTYEAQAQQAAAALARAKANAHNVEQELNRVQELIRSSIAAASELDKARADAEQARAEVQGA